MRLARRQSGVKEKLRGIMKTDEWRVREWLAAEISRADTVKR